MLKRLFLLLALLCPALPSPAAAAGLSRADVEGIVHDYLLAHPEVVIEALKENHKRQAEAAARKEIGRLTTIKNFKGEIFGPADPFLGATGAAAPAIVVFFDYNCGHCRKEMPDLEAVMRERPDLKVVFKNLAVLGPDSEAIAAISLAAVKSPKWGDLHRALMRHPGKLTGDKALGIAQQLGFDRTALMKGAMEAEKEITTVRRLAQELGIDATPTVLIGKEAVVGHRPLDQLVAKIAHVFPPPAVK